jgi:predicted outer membrane repeat protein
MYVNKASTISLNTVSVSGVSLTGGTSKGGLIFIHSNANTLSTVTLSAVTASNILSKQTGSMIHSESASATFTVSSSFFNCHLSTFTVPTDFDLSASQTSTYGNAFYIKDAVKFTSTTNTYKWCYLGNKGGVFYLENTWLVDQGVSTFTDNAAVTGGAIHCESCTGLDLKATVFTTHEAYDGGLISMVSPPTAVNFDFITVTGSSARN